jgi:predicted aminopeptidase
MLRLLDIDEERNSKEAFLRKIQSRVTLDLTGAKDDKGKLILTNDKQREAAIAEYLEANEDFRKLYAEQRTLDRERSALQATLERLRIEVKYELEAARQRNLMAELKVADAIFEARTATPRKSGAVVPFAVINGAAEPEIDMPF